jgi:2-iminoacetate synthase ThiH
MATSLIRGAFYMTEVKLSRRDSLRNLAALGVGTVVIGGATTFANTRAEAAQPHMDAALANLEAALEQLEVAAHDKGGHRVKAIALVKEAISETKKGIVVGAL